MQNIRSIHVQPKTTQMILFVVSHCLHDTVRYLFFLFFFFKTGLLLMMKNRSFIITLNAVISESVEETQPTQQPRGGCHPKIMLSLWRNIQLSIINC